MSRRSHLAHWGAFEAEVADGRLVGVHPHPGDPDPSPLLGNIKDTVRHRTRVDRPMVRAGWLDRGPGPDERRGAEPFVPVSWETATALLAAELRRTIDEHGPAAVYGGSYGWASAGRFHHAQSQVHRFLNILGGYTSSVNSYSMGASAVILPHVLGAHIEVIARATAWPVVVEHAELVVCFGGMPLKNASVSPGGVTRHTVRSHLETAAERGVEFALFSPLSDDLPEFVDARWHGLVPGTDAAVMLAIAHVLIDEDLHDRSFLDRYCVGFDRFAAYVTGAADGVPKSPEWAQALSDVPAEAIRALARKMSSRRTFVTVSWSLQRADHGEQLPWLGVTLAAMLGQIGLPGGGFGYGYGSVARVGAAPLEFVFPAFPQGTNPVPEFIPVARISDMLLHPGEPFEYDGRRLAYPHVRLVYWCGGNPFHHHQHLARLRRGLARAETIVVHESHWTSMARNADIVLPTAMTLERNDVGGSLNDSALVAMHQAVEPHGESLTDYAIFSRLAAALGEEAAFTEGRSEMDWLRHLYARWQETSEERGFAVPDFDGFWEQGWIDLPYAQERLVLFESFRDDPVRHPLKTPSGRIEIFSETIDGFGYDDCPGHPAWLEPREWLGGEAAERFPLLLIANNPRSRLHSQLDAGATSQASKVQGREPIRMHPADAARRGLQDGEVVKVFNDRGSCLAGLVTSTALRERVVQLSTGAWYDPLDRADFDSLCVHGNPNVLTFDKGTSRLAQGCSGQHALVEVERWTGPLPPVTILDPPEIQERG